jgi:hypothetical protein
MLTSVFDPAAAANSFRSLSVLFSTTAFQGLASVLEAFPPAGVIHVSAKDLTDTHPL